MCDPLKLLRKYNVKRKEIVERNGRYIFGNISLKKTMKTGIVIHGTKKKDYYTLECLVYFLKYSSLKHIAYVRQAAIDKIPAVRKEDRRSILNYLFGHTAFCESARAENADKNVEHEAKKARLSTQTKKDFPLKGKQKSLRDVMSFEQIAAIRAKYLSRKQSRQNNNEINVRYLRVKNMNGRF